MILVTGGTGLVGAHLLYLLSKTNDVIIATYRTKEKITSTKNVFSTYTTDSKAYFSKIEWIQADITTITDLEILFSKYKITQVYHCAAIVSFNPKDYQKMRQINIGGTTNLINLALTYKINKFCFVSSIATIGEAVNKEIITEENHWNDQISKSGYAITKHGAEMEVWRGSQEGLDVIIVNPGIILGSGFKDGSSKIFTQIKKGFQFYTQGKTGFVGVKDVVNIMLQLMESETKNKRFIVISENKYFQEVFNKIADQYGKKRPYIKIGKITTELFWRLDWVICKITKKEPILTKHSAKSSHIVEEFSASKIKRTLNYSFKTIDKVIEDVCSTH